MTGLRRAAIVAACAVVLPMAARADDGSDALELARRIASQFGATTTIALHALPSPFPTGVPLPNATLLGSTTQSLRPPRMIGGTPSVSGPQTSSTLYYTAADRTTVLDAYRASLTGAGWKQRDPTRGFPFQGGFTPNLPDFQFWCNAASTATIFLRRAVEDPTGFDVSVSTATGRQMQCSENGPFGAAEAMMPKPVLPKFTQPAGVTIDASGPATDGTTTAARLTSTLGLSAVFDAFASQLRAAGWNAGDRAAGTTVSAQTFTKTVDGTAYTAMLSIEVLDGTHYVAIADVSAPSP